jgi:nucleoside-diphosphate-sugar epimerase
MRPGDLYGRVVPRFIEQAVNRQPITVFGDGTQTRSFTYVTDLVEGILKATHLPNAHGEVINVGSDIEIQIIELAEIILKLTASESEITFHSLPVDDPKRRCPNISRAKKRLGWKPKRNLEEGLLKTIKWVQEKGNE